MYRLCKDGEKKGVHGEILQQWREGGGSRERLLKQFVTKAYDASESFTANKARLEALVKLKQASREWRKGMRGFEWLTEEEMTGKNWSQSKIKGAIQHCTRKKLLKDCTYENVKKYLVLVSDKVEQGDERLRELEELMSATGLWSEKFSMDLGDMLEVSDDEGEGNAPAGSGGKKKPNPFPSVDGDESLKEMLARYKKACLNRRAAFRELAERWEAEAPQAGKTLGQTSAMLEKRSTHISFCGLGKLLA
ncbi:unnamed protein product [Effrenium voratum]|nr:unnamed protein product [Effrenium voratum]